MVLPHFTHIILPPVKELATEGDLNPHAELNLRHYKVYKTKIPLARDLCTHHSFSILESKLSILL